MTESNTCSVLAVTVSPHTRAMSQEERTLFSVPVTNACRRLCKGGQAVQLHLEAHRCQTAQI